MSPILVRPVREQLEHDRVIRLLQAKYKRKFDVAINPGNEQTMPVPVGTSPWYPDLVLQSADRGRKLLGVVEVETAESVNNLEAMSQWATFSKLRAPFHLYVPASSIDTAKRLCADLQIPAAEIWAYNALGDQMRFTLVQRSATSRAPEPKPRPWQHGRPRQPPQRRPRAVQPARAALGRAARCRRSRGARQPAKKSQRRARARRTEEESPARRGRRSASSSCRSCASSATSAGTKPRISCTGIATGTVSARGFSTSSARPAACASAASRSSRRSSATSRRSYPDIAFDWKAVLDNQQIVETAPRCGVRGSAARGRRRARRRPNRDAVLRKPRLGRRS